MWGLSLLIFFLKNRHFTNTAKAWPTSVWGAAPSDDVQKDQLIDALQVRMCSLFYTTGGGERTTIILDVGLISPSRVEFKNL